MAGLGINSGTENLCLQKSRMLIGRIGIFSPFFFPPVPVVKVIESVPPVHLSVCYSDLGHQNEVVPPDKRASFSKMVPQGHHFSLNSALSTKKGYYIGAPGSLFFNKKRLYCHFTKGRRFQPFFLENTALFITGHYFSAPLALFLYRKCMEKHCPFGKWHQNGAPKGTILRTFYGQSNGAPRAQFWCHLFF